MIHLASLFCTVFSLSFSMQNHSCLFLCVFFLFAATFCHGSDLTTVEVVGFGECADCHKNNIKNSHAFSGLRVSIDCKQKDGDFKRKGAAQLDEEGRFKVLLPTEVLKDGELKDEKCFAQLHSASSAPCPSHGGLESSMIVFKSKDEGKQTFGLPGGLKFKTATCASAFFWPYFHHPPLPPLSFPVFPPHPPLYSHPYFHHKFFPPKAYPPPTPEEPLPPPVPEKPPPEPLPPPVYKPKPPVVYEPKPPKPPIYEPKPPKPPKPPVYKPKPPVYKPKPPVYKPEPPVYKPKPPVYKPKPPVYKPLPPPAPVYKHPWYKKLPPIPKLPPCPPVPKVTPIVVPPKYFSHPKYGKKFPPLAPSVPHP